MTVQLRQCVRAAQRGDKLAVEEVIREFKPFLKKQAKQYQKQYHWHYHDFDEALSTAFQGAMHCIFAYNLEQSKTVAEEMVASVHNHFRRESYANQCYHKIINKNIVENDIVTDLPETALASEDECPEQQHFQNERHRELKLALEKLPERQRQMIWLYFFQRYSYRELAKKYGLSKMAIEKQVKRGLKLMEQYLTEEGMVG